MRTYQVVLEFMSEDSYGDFLSKLPLGYHTFKMHILDDNDQPGMFVDPPPPVQPAKQRKPRRTKAQMEEARANGGATA